MKTEQANKARLEKALNKPYRFDHGVYSYKELIDKNFFKRSEIGEKSLVQWDRIKFNRMTSYKEQEEYEKKVNTKVPEYRLYVDDRVFYAVPKSVYEYHQAKLKSMKRN